MFQYNGSPVTFMPGQNRDTMINATQMAKPFGKKVNHFFEDESRRDVLLMICRRNSLNINEGEISPSEKTEEWANIFPESIRVVKGNPAGGVVQGTWFHEDIALEFARWLSPQFAIWCNDRIKELMKFGFTGTDNFIDSLLRNPEQTISTLTRVSELLVDERKKNQELSERNFDLAESNQKLADDIGEFQVDADRKLLVITEQAKQLGIQAPRVEYANKVLESTSYILITIIAKELGMGPVMLNRILKDMGVIRRVDKTWVLTHKYQGKGYTGTETYTYTDANGVIKTSVNLVWTETGRRFIHELLNPKLKKNTGISEA